jgi:amidase
MERASSYGAESMSDELCNLTATEVARLIAARNISVEEFIRSCVDRVAAREDIIGAWAHIDPDTILAEARKKDSEPVRGPLHGIPVGVKDIIDTADMPTRMGSPIYEDHQPTSDAACVAAIKDAGGIIMGKTVTTEFATFRPGKTVNPHNTAHTPGGSSSGTAAAVADNMVPAGFGTQTSGSVIRPASFCGVCGFKPSFGAVSRQGVKVIVPSFDCVGYMARSFDDLALMHGAVTGGTPGLSLGDGPGRPPRIAICRSPLWRDAEPATVVAFEYTISRLQSLGTGNEELELPSHFDALEAAHATIMDVGLARSLRPEYDAHKDLLSDRLTERMERGMNVATDDFLKALALAARCRREIDTLLSDWDAFLTPSARGEAPAGFAMTGHPTFNMIWTLLHVACVTVPGLTGPTGLPVGMQLIARHGQDMALLSLGKWLHTRLVT